MIIRLVLFFILIPCFASAQTTDTTELLRSFDIAYENDLLTGAYSRPTDYYYTGGSFIAFDLPCLKKNPISKILLHCPAGPDFSFGISFNNLGFTPTSILSDSILVGDRPFAGTIYMGLNRVSCNKNKLFLLTAQLDAGAIGPAALGYQTQKFIHAHTRNAEPHGWQFQVANDLYLNYSIVEYKGIVEKKCVELMGFGYTNAGTVYTNVGAGLKLRGGRMRSFFSAPGYTDRFLFWAYADGECKAVGYDATLQGGLINKNSPYTIPADEIKRAVFIVRAGVALAYRRFSAEYFSTFLSPEFSGGRSHNWGHLGFSITF